MNLKHERDKQRQERRETYLKPETPPMVKITRDEYEQMLFKIEVAQE